MTRSLIGYARSISCALALMLIVGIGAQRSNVD